MSNEQYLWIGFHIFILIMLALDIGVFHKKAHAISVKEALWWSAFWIALAGLFAVGVFFFAIDGTGNGVCDCLLD